MIRLFSVPSIVSDIYPRFTWRMNTKTRSIYLTFDDGPTPEATEWILSELKKFDAKATFFCVGENAYKYPGLMSQIKERGHTLGNHTFNHLNGKNTDLETYVNNVHKAVPFIQSNLFRPPYGRIMPSQGKKLIEENFKIVMWSVLTYDFDNSITPEKILRRSIPQTKPGSIIVFHDNRKSFFNLKNTLPQFLNYFTKREYEFKSIKL